ncbi:MAG TPA: hypothetical protein VGR67_14490 [Candidatus Polarisedimenticolia bacterium]|jgi:DNA-binding cell septation regulator SpoVG|nr:hypothetical protein [Candidatus Polarisedimenticolia bacterium]
MDYKVIQVDMRRFEQGTIKAYADVTISTAIGEVTIKGFRVVSKNGEAPWVGFPNITYSKNGQTVKKAVLDLRSGVKRRIEEAVLLEFKAPSRYPNQGKDSADD